MPGSPVPFPLYTGCCGWREARAKYFAHFPVVELQDTFYDPPAPALAAKWRAQAPDSFRFCLKAWQLITHTYNQRTYRRMKSAISPEEHELVGAFRPTEQVSLAWERTRQVAEILRSSVVLFQCPASFRPTRENVANFRAFFSRMESGSWQTAWEPRGAWPPELIAELCEEFRLIHCVDPFLSSPVYGETIYWRLHGGKGYGARYSDEELEKVVTWLTSPDASRTREGYLLFNNVWMREDARRFQALSDAFLGV